VRGIDLPIEGAEKHYEPNIERLSLRSLGEAGSNVEF
jgi:hypothetical protein